MQKMVHIARFKQFLDLQICPPSTNQV